MNNAESELRQKHLTGNKRILVIIPAYNEERSIGKVIKEIQALNKGLDIVVVDDGSVDDTFGEVKKHGVTCLSLILNLGIGGAVQTGFKYAYDFNYDIAVQIDADGQHDPTYINTLILPIINEEADVVIGSRFIENEGYQSTVMRKIGIRVFRFINKILIGKNITDSTSGIRAYNKSAIVLLKDNYSVDYPEPESIVFLGLRNFNIKEVPVKMRERTTGISSIRGIDALYYMVKVVLSMLIQNRRRGHG
jgi:glycosyltransferase involved in cell wall biosynthesis